MLLITNKYYCYCCKDKIKGATFNVESCAIVWAKMDSNHRRRKPADLQSAPFGHSGICPSCFVFATLISELRCKGSAYFLNTKHFIDFFLKKCFFRSFYSFLNGFSTYKTPNYNPLAEFQVNGLTSKYALHHLLC